MDLATKKLEIIKLILSLEDEQVLTSVLEYLEVQKENVQIPESTFSAEESSQLLTEYEQKVAEAQTDEDMQAIFAQYSEDELFRIFIQLRAKDAKENRHEATDAFEFLTELDKQYDSHVEEV